MCWQTENSRQPGSARLACAFFRSSRATVESCPSLTTYRARTINTVSSELRDFFDMGVGKDATNRLSRPVYVRPCVSDITARFVPLVLYSRLSYVECRRFIARYT